MQNTSTRAAGILGMLATEDVTRELHVSKVTLHRMLKTGNFPAPRKLGHRNLWPATELRKYLSQLPLAVYSDEVA